VNHVLIDQGELFHSGVSPLPALRLGSSEAQMSTVLIVDDYPAVRKALRRLLEGQLCSVVCIEAANGLDAIAKAEVSRPDLIILDLCMPEMNGFEAARVLRKTMPQIPLLMLTSHDNPAVESKAASVGIRAVFSKYAGITSLVAQASALLSLSR
jgi:CheY-like chemotaxis protein